ncbi:hypothetical protein [Streptomyces sp. NPDC001274]
MVDTARAYTSAGEMLGRLGLGDLRRRRPSQVSGGQSPRAAVARVLAHRSAAVFADESTGPLVSVNAAGGPRADRAGLMDPVCRRGVGSGTPGSAKAGAPIGPGRDGPGRARGSRGGP